MRRSRYYALIAAIFVTNAAAFGEVTYAIVDTNQTLCYDNSAQIKTPKRGEAFYGQDGNFRGNTPDYQDNGDGTITDKVTGLVWQKEYVVVSYAEAMKMAESCTLAGRDDWRVPTIKEAYSLIMFNGVDASSRNMDGVPQGAVPFIDTNYFSFKYGANGSRVIDTQMLSSTIFVGSERQTLVFGVNIADGRIKGYPLQNRDGSKMYTVRLVSGAAYGENKFVDNLDDSISDLATGLMWQRDDSGKGMDWESALLYAQQMNEKEYLGYSDWRLPNAKELQSIVDYTRSPESSSSAAIDPIFNISEIENEGGAVDYPFFWSSTTHCAIGGNRNGGATAAAYLSFGRGLGNVRQMRVGAQSRGGGINKPNWINIHGAGSQRSDPKSGDPSLFPTGRGPQGDAIRINNYVRLVRDI